MTRLVKAAAASIAGGITMAALVVLIAADRERRNDRAAVAKHLAEVAS